MTGRSRPLHRRSITLHRVIRLFGAAGACLALGACPDPMGPEEEALTRAADKWARARPTDDTYELRQRRVCFCLQTDLMVVTVTRGAVTAVRNAETGVALPVETHAWYRTVDQLFADARAVLRGEGVLREVSFHPTLGYPTLLSLDPLPMAADDEVVWETSLMTREVPAP